MEFKFEVPLQGFTRTLWSRTEIEPIAWFNLAIQQQVLHLLPSFADSPRDEEEEVEHLIKINLVSTSL